MRATSRIIQDRAGFSIWEIGRDRLEELTRFVFNVYYSHFDTAEWVDPDGDLAHMLEDDRMYAPQARVFAAIGHSGAILSTARTLERGTVELPIERDFCIPIYDAATGYSGGHRVNRIFEVARLATSATAIVNERIPREIIPQITDAVLQQVTLASSRDPGNFWVASMDNRALALFRHRGFAFQQLADTDPNYLGSPTTPVLLSVDTCRQEFLQADFAKHDHYFSRSLHRAPSTQPTTRIETATPMAA
jgi:hypothetical protein